MCGGCKTSKVMSLCNIAGRTRKASRTGIGMILSAMMVCGLLLMITIFGGICRICDTIDLIAGKIKKEDTM